MSNETIKLEADCAVATYNHHHHHHHHHHQNPHLQLHHAPIAHHQVHHVLTSAPTSPAIKAGDDIKTPLCERLNGDLINDDEEQENKNYNGDFKSSSPPLPPSSSELTTCNRTLMHIAPTIDDMKLSGASLTPQNDQTDHQHQQFSHSLVITSGDKYTQLESVNPQQIIHRDAIQTNQYQTAPSKFSSPSNSGESSEDDEIESDASDTDDEEQIDGQNDDDYGDDDNDDESEEDDDDEEEGVDDDDDEDETSQDQDCDDIVDPVGHHFIGHQNDNNASVQSVLNGNYQPVIGASNESTSDDDEDDDEDDDDVSFENEVDEMTPHDSLPSDLSLNSERMLEVTRKLVRSSERDPDRDLRKQVLLRTAIRRLPHFMETSCNHYPETFDQNFRLHNNTMNENNGTALECLSPSQYYENHNIYHLESTQPKSYYHSVQPNAIQMSTTSLRMLDLNDDQDSEIAVQTVTESIDPTSATAGVTAKHPDPQLIGYESAEHDSHHASQTTSTSLEQQHEYSNSTLYSSYPSHHHHHHHPHQSQQHEGQLNQLQGIGGLSDQRTVMHDFNQYNNVDQHHLQEATGNIIARHSTLDNLYQPLTSDVGGGDIVNELKSVESVAFQEVHDYSRVVENPDHHQCYDHIDGISVEENLSNPVMDSIEQSIQTSPTVPSDSNKSHDNINVLESGEVQLGHHNDKDDLNNNHDHQSEENQCFLGHNDAPTGTLYTDNIEPAKLLEDPSTDECTIVSPADELPEEPSINANRLNEDQASICLDGGSSSSQSSTSSEDSINSSNQSNDSAGDSTGTSILETSLNTSSDYHYRSHDSGVALFSPKSNKRTSSSIGLDDEMEIDPMSTDQTHHMSNSNQGFTGSVTNHCKRLRKKEIMD